MRAFTCHSWCQILSKLTQAKGNLIGMMGAPMDSLGPNNHNLPRRFIIDLQAWTFKTDKRKEIRDMSPSFWFPLHSLTASQCCRTQMAFRIVALGASGPWNLPRSQISVFTRRPRRDHFSSRTSFRRGLKLNTLESIFPPPPPSDLWVESRGAQRACRTKRSGFVNKQSSSASAMKMERKNVLNTCQIFN